MGVFAKAVAKAKTFEGGNYAKEGRYWVLIEAGKCDQHQTKKVEQIIYEGNVIRVLDQGPPAGQRFKPTGGGNEGPHLPADPFTLHFGLWVTGADSRLRKFLVVAAGIDEKSLPPALVPFNGMPCQPNTAWMPGQPDAYGNPTAMQVAVGTPGAVMAVDPIEYAVDQSTSPTKNLISGTIVEVLNKGITTQGKNSGGVKRDIIASEPIRRVWPSEVQAAWEHIAEPARAILTRNGRFDQLLVREQQMRQGR